MLTQAMLKLGTIESTGRDARAPKSCLVREEKCLSNLDDTLKNSSSLDDLQSKDVASEKTRDYPESCKDTGAPEIVEQVNNNDSSSVPPTNNEQD